VTRLKFLRLLMKRKPVAEQRADERSEENASD
jgi:hypothetical protein